MCHLSSRYLRQICCESTWCPGGETVSEIVCSFCPLMLYLSRWMTRLPSTVEQPLSESVNVNVGFSQNLCKGRDLIFSLDCGTRSGGKPVAFDPCNKPLAIPPFLSVLNGKGKFKLSSKYVRLRQTALSYCHTALYCVVLVLVLHDIVRYYMILSCVQMSYRTQIKLIFSTFQKKGECRRQMQCSVSGQK